MLHTRSAFSFLRGASRPEALVRRAAELGHGCLALTDRDGFYGSARAHAAAVEVGGGFRALVGTEVSMEDGSVVPLLVRERRGYQEICRTLSTAKLRASKGEGMVAWDELAACAEEAGRGSLVALTGDADAAPRRALDRADKDGAHSAARRLIDLFGKDNVVVTLDRRHLRGEAWRNRALVDLAGHLGLSFAASGAADYALPADRRLCDAFACLREKTHLDAAGNILSPNSGAHLRGPGELAELYADLPAALDGARRLTDSLGFTLCDLGYQFPRYPTPRGESETAVLRRETFAGAHHRYGTTLSKKVRRQLEHELALIGRLGFCGYFLIVWDIVNAARENNVLVQGRGSAANSAVCYSLGLTAVDPIGAELLFERFLSEGRESWPDIDLDLPSGDRRESVIQMVYRKYAPRGAAMTANVITYRGRSAMREMGKALNIPQDVLGRFSDLFARGDFPHTMDLRDQLREAGLPAEHPRLGALAKLYRAVLGMPRHLGQHSGGMIISDRPLDTLAPLENASMPGRVVFPWDKDDCEDLGIVKVDLLGLGMLSAVQDTLALCNSRPGREVELAQIPKDDTPTYDMICRADTIGLFQIESRAQQACLPRMQPRIFYDVAIQTALIRPGPIVGNLVHPYLNRRRGREPVTYLHPKLEPALRRTLGIPLFQEQVLKMAMLIAGFDGSEAEELRRALSFRRSPERMEKILDKLRRAMAKHEVAPETGEQIIDSIRSFALYGFPESHAISFALIAYASAWLKLHRLPEFLVGLLNNQPMGFYSPATLLEDARRHGLTVLPPCANASEALATVVDDGTIRLGLNQIKGLSSNTAERLTILRPAPGDEEGGDSGEGEGNSPSLDILLAKVQPNAKERRALARSGALDALTAGRRDALWKVEAPPDPEGLFAWAGERAKLAEIGDGSSEIGDAIPSPQLPSPISHLPSPLAEMTPAEVLISDYSTLRLSTTGHPMAMVRGQIPEVTPAAGMLGLPNGTPVIAVGMAICRQRPGTAKGHMFISLEDETGIANAFVPADTFEAYRLTITQEPFLELRGRLQNADGVATLFVVHAAPFPYAPSVKPQTHDFR